MADLTISPVRFRWVETNCSSDPNSNKNLVTFWFAVSNWIVYAVVSQCSLFDHVNVNGVPATKEANSKESKQIIKINAYLSKKSKNGINCLLFSIYLFFMSNWEKNHFYLTFLLTLFRMNAMHSVRLLLLNWKFCLFEMNKSTVDLGVCCA